MNIVHIMMNAATNKDKILEASRKEALEKGLENIGMREIAAASSIALGTLYNYFPNKDALILSTISSIWKEALESLTAEYDFGKAIDNVYKAILRVDDTYSGFLSTHASMLKGKSKGREEMVETQNKLKEYLLSSMDPMMREKIKKSMNEDEFMEFILINIIISAMKKDEPKILKTIVSNLF